MKESVKGAGQDGGREDGRSAEGKKKKNGKGKGNFYFSPKLLKEREEHTADTQSFLVISGRGVTFESPGLFAALSTRADTKKGFIPVTD